MCSSAAQLYVYAVVYASRNALGGDTRRTPDSVPCCAGREMFYQEALRRFGDLPRITLSPPMPLRALMAEGAASPRPSAAPRRTHARAHTTTTRTYNSKHMRAKHHEHTTAHTCARARMHARTQPPTPHARALPLAAEAAVGSGGPALPPLPTRVRACAGLRRRGGAADARGGDAAECARLLEGKAEMLLEYFGIGAHARTSCACTSCSCSRYTMLERERG